MDYKYCLGVKEDKALRDGFQQLTRNVFGFDFINWYNKGYWGDKYIPHVITHDNKVIANVSVNIMTMKDNGQVKNYIQLGTVMTDLEYRQKGLSKFLINKVLEEYRDKADGIYLFGNDSVVGFYPQFGFREMEEYEYTLRLNQEDQLSRNTDTYVLESVDISDESTRKTLTETIGLYDQKNPNEAFGMCANPGLYQFWLDAGYGENIYYLPELKAYIIAEVKDQLLMIYQIISDVMVDMRKLSRSFEDDIVQIKLGFTPADKTNYDINIHKEEDCTLFVLGNDLYDMKEKKYMFPVISHA